jgi:hypothetical protein
MVETALNILGLLFTGIGASIAARAVIISENQASLLSGPQSHGNKELGDALVRQSRSAQKGLLCVVVGEGFADGGADLWFVGQPGSRRCAFLTG